MTEDAKTTPKGCYWADVKGRDILVKHANEAQAMVLGGLNRRMKAPDVSDEAGLDVFGKLMRLFEALVVEQADRDWLEGEIIDGNVTLSDFGSLFFNVEQKETAPVKVKPRRGK